MMAEDLAPRLGEPLAIEFANTRFARRGVEHDALRSPAETTEWLQSAGQLLPVAPGPEALGAGEHAAAVELRDALRTLFAQAVAGERLDPDATGVVNRAVRAAPQWRELALDGGPRAVPATQAPAAAAALGLLAQEAIDLLTSPEAASLRSCAAPGCILFFRKDHPRRVCCSARCSNRVRAARHYARRT